MDSLDKNELNGFIVIDKPVGPTSHQIDSWVRDLTGETRVGHAGTLDPNVSGVLVMALGKATKLIDIIHEKPKEYVAVMRLYTDASKDIINNVFKEFTDKIYQLPPVRSAVARELRERKIYNMDILEIKDKLILFSVKCESGTYIRTLCTDMGYVIGTGAQMADLRRLSTGDFNENNMHTLQELSDAIVLKNNGDQSKFENIFMPMDFVFKDKPKIIVKNTAVKNIENGSDIFPQGIKTVIGNPKKGDLVAVYTDNNELIAYGKMLVDEINDLKVIDITGVLGDSYGKNNVVRKSNERKNIQIQKPGKKLHGNIRNAEKRKNTGNRRRTFGGYTGTKNNAPNLRKGKNK